MIDPRTLRSLALNAFDPAHAIGDFDRDEPCEIERTVITNDDVADLAGVPFAADSCVFAGCDLSVTDVIGVRNSLFVNCKLRGTRFGRYVRNVVFNGCQLAECSFRTMALETVTFEACQLVGSDFYESSLTQIVFPGSSIEGVGFDRCALTDVDLTGASDLRIGDPRTLAGAAICETQAPLVARRLAELSGIDVRDC
ncbi:MAG: pentapeptide repeat-containing protein [Acidimicrobiaceae bacterium]|nr:pentapeptide repeat-containing protein [Acidimicrobiaceae bacterium]